MPRFTDQEGNVWEAKSADDPNPVLVQPARRGGGVFVPDPSAQYEAPKAAAQVQGQNLNNQGQAISNRVAAATADADVQKARADADKARADAEKAALEIEQARMNMVQGKDPEAAVRAAKSILRLLDDKGGIQEQFDNNLSGTSILEYLPTEDMRSFDANAGFLKPAAKKLFRAKGEGSQSDAEGRDYNALVPNTWNTDATNAALIANLRAEAIATLDEYGVQVPEYDPADPQQRANALTYLRTDGGRTQGLEAAQGNTRAVPYPDEGQAEHDALVASLIAANGGRLDPQAYARARAQLDQKYGMQGDPAAYASWATGINEYLDNGGATIPTGIEAGQEEMGWIDSARNAAVNNPVGAAAAGYLNSATFGAPEAMSGGNMDALRDEYTLSTLGGEIGGAITGTGILGGAGRLGLRAMGRQGIQSNFGRNLATDAAYGGLYGGITEGDPVTGAAFGAVGSTLGQGAGKVAGDAIGGVRLGDAAQRLRDRGINLTTGRILGDTASAIEDKMVSLPFVGDMVRRRQGESFQDFNQAAFREAGAPIGFQPANIGRQGVTDLMGDPANQVQGAVGRAYSDAVGGRTFFPDSQFDADIASAMRDAERLTPDYREMAEYVFDNRISPFRGETYYHGTRAEIDGPLRPSESGMLGPGLYVTKRPNIAKEYGENIHEARVSTSNLASLDEYQEVLSGLPKGGGYEGEMARRAQAVKILQDRGFLGIDANDAQSMATLFDPNVSRSVTGPQYQSVRSDISGYRASETGPGIAKDYRDVLGRALTALDDLVKRQGGEEVVTGLENANESYRLGKILQDASDRAKGGSSTGSIRVFSPSQLQAANQASGRKFPGKNPLEQLADDGQAVLPSTIPNSGTADRLAMGGLILGGGAGGTEYMTQQDLDATATGLGSAGATLAALTALGSRRGQKALETILLDRPDALKRFGEGMRRRKGLFGSAAVPIALSAQ